MFSVMELQFYQNPATKQSREVGFKKPHQKKKKNL